MTPLATGAATPRPFVPAKDFALSKRFYETLGFAKTLDDPGVAIFEVGTGSFILQNHFQQQWADNFMMQLLVDDLDAWWAHVQALDLPASFGVRPPVAPAMQPWGMRVAYVFDPCGVLWHLAEDSPGAAPD